MDWHLQFYISGTTVWKNPSCLQHDRPTPRATAKSTSFEYSQRSVSSTGQVARSRSSEAQGWKRRMCCIHILLFWTFEWQCGWRARHLQPSVANHVHICGIVHPTSCVLRLCICVIRSHNVWYIVIHFGWRPTLAAGKACLGSTHVSRRPVPVGLAFVASLVEVVEIVLST